MGRLIDAEKYPCNNCTVSYCYKNCKKHDAWLEGCDYDTEKVIAELEKESDFFSGKPMGTLQKAYYCKGIERATEIVRKGGVE